MTDYDDNGVGRSVPGHDGHSAKATMRRRYWQDLWATGEESAGEVAILTNKVILDSDPSANLMFIDGVQQQLDD